MLDSLKSLHPAIFENMCENLIIINHEGTDMPCIMLSPKQYDQMKHDPNSDIFDIFITLNMITNEHDEEIFAEFVLTFNQKSKLHRSDLALTIEIKRHLYFFKLLAKTSTFAIHAEDSALGPRKLILIQLPYKDLYDIFDSTNDDTSRS